MRPVVIAECIRCKKSRDIEAGEIPEGEMPMCDECYMPMVAVRAETRR